MPQTETETRTSWPQPADDGTTLDAIRTPHSVRTGDIVQTDGGYARCTVLARGRRVKMVPATPEQHARRPISIKMHRADQHAVGDIVDTDHGTIEVKKISKVAFQGQYRDYIHYARGPLLTDEQAERKRHRHYPTAIVRLAGMIGENVQDGVLPVGTELVIDGRREGYGDIWYATDRDAVCVQARYDWPTTVGIAIGGARELRRIAKLTHVAC